MDEDNNLMEAEGRAAAELDWWATADEHGEINEFISPLDSWYLPDDTELAKQFSAAYMTRVAELTADYRDHKRGWKDV